MAEVAALERARMQGQRLRLLRERLGLKKSALSDRLGFGTTQAYDLYERGNSVIRMDRVDAWADAFEMSRQDFVETVMGAGDPAADGWSFRAALHGIIPEWLIEQLADEWEGRPLINQRAAVDGILMMAQKRRARVHNRAKSRPA